MSYTPYLNVDEYTGNVIPNDDVEKYLTKAHRHIDTLTFNRITGKFDRLTKFQQGIVKEVCSSLAEFEYENADMLESVFKGYSINGVSADFGGENFKVISGVAIPKDLYQTLCQTGLCCRMLGVRI